MCVAVQLGASRRRASVQMTLGAEPRQLALDAGLKLSGLPHHKTLDEFDFACQPGLYARKIQDLASLSFVSGGAKVALLGPPRMGTTTLAVALGEATCQAGFSIYSTTLDGMVRNLRGPEATARFRKKVQTYLKPSVVVVDEIGYLGLSRVRPGHRRLGSYRCPPERSRTSRQSRRGSLLAVARDRRLSLRGAKQAGTPL